MPDEKQRYEPVPNAPIPTYEEAIGSSSRTAPPRPNADDEAAEPAEREGLLGASESRTPVPTRRAGYRPPPTEESSSVRDEDDNERDTFLGQDGGEGPRRRESQETEEELEVRREMEEMEYDEPARPQSAWGKRISSLSASLSSIHLPFKIKWKFKLKWPTITADICILIGRCFAVLMVMAVVYLLFMSDIFTSAATRMTGQMFDPESVRRHVQNMASEVECEKYLKMVTATDHLAGTEGDYFLAKAIKTHFERVGLLEGVRLDEYGVYLNYPKKDGRRVEILHEDGMHVKWTAKLEEDNLYKDRQQTPVFHGHSKSGDVRGPLVYANYGSREDFKYLKDKGVKTNGAIALVRYYGTQGDRALKVKAAQMAGFAGCLIYSDPADDGFKKGGVAPDGRYMPEQGVQRGAVSLMSWVVGDVLTPGFSSKKGAERISKDNNPGLVGIPSLPLSWGDAQHLLKAIKGVGEKVPNEWVGGIDGVEYWTGSAKSVTVRLLNDQDEVEQQPIWNVVGRITGIEQSEKKVIIGNHRDAWVYGATDPGSGTAVFLEVIRIFGDLVRQGWRPLRTIEFISWDGEEYNLIGSTEHVEEHIEALRKDAFVYLNMDVAVGGNEFRAAGSPIFKKALLEVLDRTSDTVQNATMRALWEKRKGQLEGLGAGSDYVAFQDIAGTSSLDIGFQGAYPYHSAYDNFEWMATVGDPGFHYHKTMAEIMGLLILEFSDKLILPFDMPHYSAQLNQWTIELENWAKSKGSNQDGKPKWSIEPLRQAVMQFAKDSRMFSKFEIEWDSMVLASGGFENSVMAAHRRSHNNRMANFETHLLDLEEGGGIPNRTQFKHVVFGPQLWSGYDEAFFPAIRDAVEADDWELAQKQLEKAASLIHKASRQLVGNKNS